MKDPFDRTKVVLRHLPPTLSQSALTEQIDGRFAGRYKWICFRSGKNSQKHQRYSRAYIDFKRPEDVIEFAEFFDGHIFVNEKGSQFKTIVEYAPSQRVAKSWSKKDGREGTIFKDPEYLEFLDLISKPVENLPSAEVQLERREAERAGAAKEVPIVTPLMDFVRQKRAAKGGSQRSLSNGKLSRRATGTSPGSSGSSSTKRGSEKRRVSTSMYVLRDSVKNTSGKDKSTYILVPRREDQELTDKSVSLVIASGTETAEDEKATGSADTGKKKVLLLKGKEREIPNAPEVGVSQQQSVISPIRNSPNSTAFKQSQRRDVSGRMIRSILSKEARQGQSTTAIQSDQQSQTMNLEKEKRPPRPTTMRSVLKDHLSSISQAASSCDTEMKRIQDDKVAVNDVHGVSSVNEKQEKRARNKDRPDRGVWTPLRRSDISHASDDSSSSSFSGPTQVLSDSLEGMTINQLVAPGAGKLGDDVLDEPESGNKSFFPSGKARSQEASVHNSRVGRGGNVSSAYDSCSHEVKSEIHHASKGEVKTIGSGRSNFSSAENGSHRQFSRRGSVHGGKDIDGNSLSTSDGKPSKRGNATGYGSHEKQVWVQKLGSGS
ncbi:PREDICTED: regulator of nonsense transcripts UPF3 isoform X2 [Nelumbo nucifera]|uniref:Regulator of nonsense transcripts UPF3 isoform X2 n=1 Tax=Nelumbo nucifera TaxID=4432 RepID=A0A1U7Z3M6_NELNU|nr:PREDICTED: regulator of nonsense transcripts UPF3 isoform X2 [Nelumbo nucifera]